MHYLHVLLNVILMFLILTNTSMSIFQPRKPHLPRSVRLQWRRSKTSQKLNDIEQSILVATPESNIERVNKKHTVDGSSKLDWSDDDIENSLNVIPTPKQRKPLQHPHFGGKWPKTVCTPLKCINFLCKKRRREER